MKHMINNNIVFGLGFIFAISSLSACVTSSEISVSDEFSVRKIDESLDTINTVTLADPYKANEIYPEGFHVVELESSTDLENIVRSKDMPYLYYNLYFCDESITNQIIFDSEVFIAPAKNDGASNLKNRYYAFIPNNIKLAIENWFKFQSKDASAILEEVGNSAICLSLASENLLGQKLNTNRVRVNKATF